MAQLTKPVNEDTEDKSETEGPVWQSFVLHNGNVVIDPTRQYIAEASQLWDGEVLSSQGTELIQQLQVRAPAGRRWMIPGVGDTMLLLCGEANVVAGGGPSKCWNYESVEAAGLTEATLKTIRVVANPAHTRSGPQALRDKRAWLSRGGLLLHTANTYSGGWLQGVEEALGRASYTAARAWVKGKPSPLNEYPEDGFKVFTLNWEP